MTQFSKHWKLRPGLIFLNHGSFGATPTCVLDIQKQLIHQLESDLIEFLAPERSLEGKLDPVREKLAELVGGKPSNIAFVRNATEGINAVLRSFPWQHGDQIIITSHGYNACNNAARFLAAQFGLDVIEAVIPFPIHDNLQVVDAIERLMNHRTRLLMVDHVTSPTGLVFPLEQIIQLAKQRDVRVLVDGAHAPGMLKLDLEKLAPDYYTANHHKWLCAPKVSGFLYVAPQWQCEVRPTVISHAANRPRPNRSRFIAEFDWTGTFDPTPLLALPAAIDFLTSLYPGGIDHLMRVNQEKTLAAREMFLSAFEIDCPAPESMLGTLAAIPLSSARFKLENLKRLKAELYDTYHIEIPVFPSISAEHPDDYILRIAMQAYNDLDQIEHLIHAVRSILGA